MPYWTMVGGLGLDVTWTTTQADLGSDRVRRSLAKESGLQTHSCSLLDAS